MRLGNQREHNKHQKRVYRVARSRASMHDTTGKTGSVRVVGALYVGRPGLGMPLIAAQIAAQTGQGTDSWAANCMSKKQTLQNQEAMLSVALGRLQRGLTRTSAY